MLAALHEQPAAQLRVDRAGSLRFDAAQHVLLEGDNLQALELLAPAYSHRVQAVYLDPPYNTGRDFVYRDRFAEGQGDFLRRTGQVDDRGEALVANPSASGRHHSAWLSMIYPRLWWIRQLMAEHGVLFCSIDDHEVHRLRMVLDEVFGEECFIAQIVVVTNRGGRDYLRIATGHEYLLCYGATPDAPIRELPRAIRSKHADARGPYELRELRNRNPKFHPGNRPNLHYPIYVDPSRASGNGEHPVSVEPAAGFEIEVRPMNSAGQGSVWRWGRPKTEVGIVAGDPEASEVVARKRRDGGWNIYEKHRKQTTRARGLWDDTGVRTERGTIDLRERLGAAVFDHPKPVELVRRCLQLATDPDGIVLDPFAGSGTTAEAVLRQNEADGGNRRALLVQLAESTPSDSPARAAGYETVAQVCRARIEAALQGRPVDGLRCFTVEPERSDRAGVEAGVGLEDVEALRAREARRTADQVELVWHRALRAGIGLDARLERRGSFEVLVDAPTGRMFAWSTDASIDRRAVEALELSPSATVIVPDLALSDADRIALAASLRVESW